VSLTLHYFPGNASLTPHMLLRELGVPFELQRVDRAANAQKSPAYLKLNPNGLIPVLQDGDLVLYETPAIVLHLLDTHPQAGLAPAVGTHERAEFYKWLMWLSGLQALAPHYFYSERLVAPGNTAGAAEVKAQVEARIAALIDQIDARLASQPWMGGAHFSALDLYTFMLCRWTRGMQRPARTLPHIGPYLQRVLARPAVQQTLAAEGLQAPFV
jgi:glutathione S-transferase